ncbi:outer membrane beta-barrel protein [Methylobacterium nonmethylotrophicum]|uniref:outer membrane beta-barrel protein n=1 Tax=Methylobacterium nonmethylotrophicum TaxID=1141884 RepID=UPI001FE04D2F|nr:outer membrane beta-barrel protein [Methylobacterium nonmethylotrophicum]
MSIPALSAVLLAAGTGLAQIVLVPIVLAQTALAQTALPSGAGASLATDPILAGPLPGGQDPDTFALRGTNPALSRSLPRAGARPAGGSASRSGARPRTPPQRRTRQPTTAIIRQTTQQDVSDDLRLRPTVQIPVSGLPDIATAGTPLLRRRLDPLDPYAPLGIRAGSLTLYPALQQSVGYDSNPDRSTVRRGSMVLRSQGELRVESDWSSHSLTGELRGGYFAYPDNPNANRPDGDGAMRLRLDVTRDTKVDVEGRYGLSTQRAGSPDLNAQVRDRPLVATYGGTVGVTQNFNRLQVTVSGLVDRQTFENAQLTDGTVLRQDDRNVNQFGLRLRTGYEIRPGFTPFVDTLVDTRIHDFVVDQYGLRRDSDGITVRGGTTFEVSRLLTGEVSGGYLSRRYADSRLRDVTGPVVDGAVTWAATPLTSLRVGASTGVIETIVPGASGIVTRTAVAELTHDLRRNLRLTLTGTLISNDYQGTSIREQGYSAGVKLDYRLNRWLGLRASYAREALRSTAVGSSYHADTYLVGLRVNP